jgi:hypothetical protein
VPLRRRPGQQVVKAAFPRYAPDDSVLGACQHMSCRHRHAKANNLHLRRGFGKPARDQCASRHRHVDDNNVRPTSNRAFNVGRFAARSTHDGDIRLPTEGLRQTLAVRRISATTTTEITAA